MAARPSAARCCFSCPLALKEFNRSFRLWSLLFLGSLPGDLPSPTALAEGGPVRAGCPAPAHDHQSESAAAAAPAVPLPSQRPRGRRPSYTPLRRLRLHRQGQLPLQRTRRAVHPVTRLPTQPAEGCKHGAWLFLLFVQHGAELARWHCRRRPRTCIILSPPCLLSVAMGRKGRQVVEQ